MRTWLGLLLMVGCTGDTDSTSADTETGESVDTGTDTIDPDIQTQKVDDSGFLSGTVLDEAGQPIPDVIIRFCRGLACRNGTTDATGAYEFDEVVVDWHALEMRPPLASNGLATTYIPLEFVTDENRTVNVVMPSLDPATTLPASTPQEIETGEGLFLEVSADMLEEPLFKEPATEIAGVSLETDWFQPVDQAGTVLAMWYLSPFEYHAEGGIPARLENTLGLDDGTELEVYVGSYSKQRWLLSGTVTAQGKDLVGDVSLEYTSTVVLIQPDSTM